MYQLYEMKTNASQHIVCLVILIFHFPTYVTESNLPVSESCTEGSSDIACSPNCVPLSDRHNSSSCNVNTGLCYDGCQVGFYGEACNLTCSRNCPNETCHQDNGHCSFRCSEDICGDFCDQNCDIEEKNITSSTNPDCDGADNALLPAVVVLAVLLFISISIFICCCIKAKFLSLARSLYKIVRTDDHQDD